MTLTPFPSCLPKPRQNTHFPSQGQENDNNHPGTSVSALRWHSRLPTFFTRRPAVWRERRRYGCNLTPAGVCWKDLEERESQAFLSSSSLTADLWLRHPDYTQTCQRNSTSIFLELNNAGRSRKSSHSTIGAPSHLWWNFCTQIYIDIHVK